MDAAKIAWLLYEQPDTNFEFLSSTFMDIRKRVYNIKLLGQKANMVCIPTTTGTGSLISPFSVISDSKTGKKYPLADYNLTPNMVIIDSQLVVDMPKN
jgi:acetaldehyde dehydrogenase/alcohol dehydrogenase